MRRFFADTFYWVALLFRRDTSHARVTACSHTLARADVFYTTAAVILGVLAAFSAAEPYRRQQAATRMEEMLTDPGVRVVEVTRARLLEGLALTQPDKAYSLTGCIC